MALLVDSILLAVVSVLLGLAFVPSLDLDLDLDEIAAPILAYAGVVMLLVYGYFVVATGVWGRTVGKRLLGLRVVDSSGNTPGIGRALLREGIGKWLSGMVCYLGYLWVAWDPRKQGWHDKVAGTTVRRG